jgi:hypothetical protein
MAVVRVRYWLGIITAALTLNATHIPATVLTETYVEQVRVEVEREPWQYRPLDRDLEQHAQCLIDVVSALGLELTVDTLFVVGDYADLQGGPCGLLE